MMARHKNVELVIQYLQHLLRESGFEGFAQRLEGIEIRSDQDIENALAIVDSLTLQGTVALERNRLLSHARTHNQLKSVASAA